MWIMTITQQKYIWRLKGFNWKFKAGKGFPVKPVSNYKIHSHNLDPHIVQLNLCTLLWKARMHARTDPSCEKNLPTTQWSPTQYIQHLPNTQLHICMDSKQVSVKLLHHILLPPYPIELHLGNMGWCCSMCVRPVRHPHKCKMYLHHEGTMYPLALLHYPYYMVIRIMKSK